jgi:hypothetical protein
LIETLGKEEVMKNTITVVRATWNPAFTSAHCTCGYMSNWSGALKTEQMAAKHARKCERAVTS